MCSSFSTAFEQTPPGEHEQLRGRLQGPFWPCCGHKDHCFTVSQMKSVYEMQKKTLLFPLEVAPRSESAQGRLLEVPFTAASVQTLCFQTTNGRMCTYSLVFDCDLCISDDFSKPTFQQTKTQSASEQTHAQTKNCSRVMLMLKVATVAWLQQYMYVEPA